MPSLFQFVLFWTHVAERFADNPYVLGYEIMNEPWCGNTWQEPDLLVPGDGVYERDFWDFAKVEILYENGPIFATFRAISYIFVLLSIRHFCIIWHAFHSKFRMHSNKNLNNNKFL